MPHLRRISLAPGHPTVGYPFDIPAVAALGAGLELPPGVTYLVGENGTGKSTLLEALALHLGFNGEGGTRSIRHQTHASESSLHEHLVVERAPGGIGAGFFLRAETMHGLFTRLETMDYADLGPYGGRSLHGQSHGEAFLSVLRHRMSAVGLYLMDEPEAALSFRGCLALLAMLNRAATSGSQVIIATHSPVLTALPGARLCELTASGLAWRSWAELDLVDSWRGFLADPELYFRHLLGPD